MKDKKSRIEDIMYDYNQTMVEAITVFNEAIHLLSDDKIEEFESKVKEITQIEAKSDRLKEKLIELFIKRETMAFSRADRIDLVDEIDYILDRIEYCARTIQTHPIKTYAPIAKDFKKYSNDLAEIVKTLSGAINMAETDLKKAIEATKLIESLRRSARSHSFEIMKDILKFEFSNLEKILLYTTTKYLLGILDKAEEVSDFLRKIAIKYLVLS
ncbi:MAG: DUF47 domain-containing protein [Promethearchaeota archaeon]